MSSVSEKAKAVMMGVVDVVEQRMDEWDNYVTLLGTRDDKSTRTKFSRRAAKHEQELDALFDTDDMAYRICTAGPEAAMRKGFEVQLDTPEWTTALTEEFERLSVAPVLLEALIA